MATELIERYTKLIAEKKENIESMRRRKVSEDEIRQQENILASLERRLFIVKYEARMGHPGYAEQDE